MPNTQRTFQGAGALGSRGVLPVVRVQDPAVYGCRAGGWPETAWRQQLDPSRCLAGFSHPASPGLVAAIRGAYAIQEQKLEEPLGKGVHTTHISRTDREATMARGGSGQISQLSYRHHRAVDDANGVITAVQTTTGVAGGCSNYPVYWHQTICVSLPSRLSPANKKAPLAASQGRSVRTDINY